MSGGSLDWCQHIFIIVNYFCDFLGLTSWTPDLILSLGGSENKGFSCAEQGGVRGGFAANVHLMILSSAEPAFSC